jgi:hypothetical protein
MYQPQMDGSPLLMEGITIPYVEVLWLNLQTNGHVFEGRVLQLLTRSSGIRELKLSFQDRDEVIIPFVICYYSTLQHPVATVLNNRSYTWSVKLGNLYSFVIYFGTIT